MNVVLRPPLYLVNTNFLGLMMKSWASVKKVRGTLRLVNCTAFLNLTACPKSLYPSYVINQYIKRVKTSWRYSTTLQELISYFSFLGWDTDPNEVTPNLDPTFD